MITRTLFPCLLLLAASVFVPGQCPELSVTAPDTVDEGSPVTFSLTLTSVARGVTATYNWTVSAGIISSGQGQPSITVDTSAVGGSTITATVSVGGFLRRCPTAKSATVYVQKPVLARKMDEFGPIAPGDQKARLDNFAIELQNDPTAQGYVIAYGGRKSARGTAGSRLKAARVHLINIRGVANDRIVLIDGGYQEQPATELWIVPQRAAPPQASPTVDPSELRAPAKKKPATKKPATKKN